MLANESGGFSGFAPDKPCGFSGLVSNELYRLTGLRPEALGCLAYLSSSII